MSTVCVYGVDVVGLQTAPLNADQGYDEFGFDSSYEGLWSVSQGRLPLGAERGLSRLYGLGRDLGLSLVLCPERALLGNLIHEVTYYERTVGGTMSEAAQHAAESWTPCSQGAVVMTSATTPEIYEPVWDICRATPASGRTTQCCPERQRLASFECDRCDCQNVEVWRLQEPRTAWRRLWTGGR